MKVASTRGPTTRAVVVLALVALLSGCLMARPGTSGGSGERATLGVPTAKGQGSFLFRPGGALRKRPVRVFFAAPRRVRTARILIVMHGQERDAARYREDWLPHVRGRHVLLLVPRFSDRAYPGSDSYNQGRVLDSDGDVRPREKWSFEVIEQLFDRVVSVIGGAQTRYAIYGHSAGAQFVHRFVTLESGPRVRVAVAANAGWYTTLDDGVPYPYGLDGSPSREEDLRTALGTRLVVMLGADDIDSDDSSLRHDELSDAQGANRLERGVNFFLTSRESADEHGLPFRWRLAVVPDVAHSDRDMARAAVRVLVPRRRAG